MVSNRLTALMFLCLIALCAVPVYADDSLELTQVRIFVDGTRATNIDEEGGDTVDDDIYPGSTIKVRLTLENTYSNDDETDIEIEDITVEGTIVDVDLGADVDDEVDEFDLDAEEDKEVTLTFDIPDEVQQDTYRLEIEIEGEADDGTKFEINKDYFVKVQKRERDVRIVSASLKDSVVQCGEETTLSVTVQNFGREDEQRARIKVENDEIPLNYASMFYLDSKVGADNNKYTRDYPIEIPKDFEAKKYDIIISSFYQKTVETDSSLVLLEVQCDPEAIVEEPVQPKEEPKQNNPTQNNPTTATEPQETTSAPTPVAVPATPDVAPVQPAEEVVEEESPLSKYKWVILIAFMNVLILLIGIGILLFFNKPRKGTETKETPEKNHFLDQLHEQQKKVEPRAAPVTEAAIDAQNKPKKPFTFSYYDLKE